MDSGRTPNHPKPVGSQQQSTDSRSKFARPKSHQKQDAKASGFKSLNASVMGPSRPLNRTVRQNLDMTLSGAGPSKSSICPSANDELEYDLAYNAYLQALMKRQLAEKIIEEHELKLNDQILIQSEHLHKLENTFTDISDQIEKIKEQSDIAEVLQMLMVGLSEIETFCSRYNTYNRMNELNKILTQESNLVSVRNIKPINSQEEYDNLILTLDNLKCVLEKIIKQDKKFKEVHELSTSIKAFTELNCAINGTVQKLSTSNKKAAELALKLTSDFFAQQGGYF